MACGEEFGRGKGQIEVRDFWIEKSIGGWRREGISQNGVRGRVWTREGAARRQRFLDREINRSLEEGRDRSKWRARRHFSFHFKKFQGRVICGADRGGGLRRNFSPYGKTRCTKDPDFTHKNKRPKGCTPSVLRNSSSPPTAKAEKGNVATAAEADNPRSKSLRYGIYSLLLPFHHLLSPDFISIALDLSHHSLLISRFLGKFLEFCIICCSFTGIAMGGGFSPSKLRIMLLGADKRRKGEGEIESTSTAAFSLRPDAAEIDYGVCLSSGVSTSANCKDVNIVSITSSEASDAEVVNDHRLKDRAMANSRIRSQDLGCVDYDSGVDNASISSLSAFEFQKAERAPQRFPFTPFSRTPSKWDDAQKWIASPTSNRPKIGQSQVQGGQAGPRKAAGLGNRQSSTKVVVEVPDQRMITAEEVDTKRIDPNQTKRMNWIPHPCPVTDSTAKPAFILENSIPDSAISLSQHDPSLSLQSATTFIQPPSTVRSVSMRDMGTEMTPIASQEPSRNGTPVRATTPTRSPNSSRPSTPVRAAPTSVASVASVNCQEDPGIKELSEKELQMKTRREIMVLGTQLGKMNIAAWASKEEEDTDASTSLKNVSAKQPAKSVIETRAVAWEEAEKAKYMASATDIARSSLVKVEVERMRARAHDKLMNKLAAARHKAEEKHAAAEAKRNRQAARTEQQAEYIRRTGRIPSSFSCWNCRHLAGLSVAWSSYGSAPNVGLRLGS
ncbi:hypothetical protein ACLOJK_017238 [Asimina triloba]